MDKYERWKNDYINNLNIDDLDWLKLNSNDYRDFVHDNYYDEEIYSDVLDKNASNIYSTLFGMHYLTRDNYLYNNSSYDFLLGTSINNKGKKTIVCASVIIDKYILFSNQEKPLTYISSVETNKYFMNKGIFKKMCNIFYNYVNKDQHILTSAQSFEGKNKNVFNIFKSIMFSNGFDKLIIEESPRVRNLELYDILVKKKK